MDNFIFCLNATMPIFFTMLLGVLFQRVGLFDDGFVNKLNKFVFNAALPALLFNDISTVDFREVWDGRMVAFCFSVTLLSICISTAVSYLFDRKIQGEFIQGSYRSSSAILGIAFMQNLYGTSKIAPLMVIASVPLYNVMAVVVLSLFKPDREKFSGALIKKTLSGILHNPIILGIAVGVLWSVLRLPQPVILEKTTANLGVLATPLGLMAMGGSIRLKQAFSSPVPTVICTAMKLCGYVSLFLPIAVHMGFREEKLVAMLVMLGSSTTVSCFIMAKNMGHEGQFSSGIIMMTTLFSAVTLTAELFLLKSMGLI
ncbi:AEC family transporter [Clostridium sp. AM58-1XD]|uniref:AEC family transporter n=1 Tax=Clostridium sp. AM58-1XD TaxID=2292307 RepID=UPI000E4F48D4|nr:AEC family transporter [Clostridium sp. AM58-1XD]RGZ01818.1 hypothetical protein DXA13_00420 [Clostridium sp. AM58-1XD]